MARSRAVARGLPVFPVIVAALLGSVGWGWFTGGRTTARLPATVIRVVDGDTVIARLSGGQVEKIRLLGADTPEVVDPRKPVQCFGPEASAYTSRVRSRSRISPGGAWCWSSMRSSATSTAGCSRT